FVEHASALKVGDPMEDDTNIGPMARANLRDDLHQQVLRTLENENTVLKLGGAPVDGPGFYYPPTVIDHVRPGDTAFEEETFGPVAAIIRARDTAHAIELANDTEYGLGAALWTGDLDRARRLTREIDAGAVFVNGMVASDARLPFGGIKASGYGRELGVYGLREFVNVKTVWIGPAKTAPAATIGE
ncbi:MAG: aldehyde dehydrogenase family protein, partial [Microbacterium sp.]|nr:aldehyde dehydrogenase family protein [Microbacterium sp.]